MHALGALHGMGPLPARLAAPPLATSWRNTQLRLAPPPLSQVWEPDVPPPPASPPAQFPPADLFPDQRIAVYRITRRTGSQPGQLSQPAG